MCQCGCGDFQADQVLPIQRGPLVSVSIYRGCADCFPGIAVDLNFFTRKNEWTRGVRMQPTIVPSEDGGKYPDEPQRQLGLPIPLFEVQDMIAAAKELDADASLAEYGSIGDWLHDEGLEFLQTALRIGQKRLRELEAQPEP